MSEDIIDFYRQANAVKESDKISSELEQPLVNPVPVQESSEKPAELPISTDDPLNKFLLTLSESIKKEKANIIVEQKIEESSETKVIEKTEPGTDPLDTFINKFQGIVQSNREKKVKAATLDFINNLKEAKSSKSTEEKQSIIEAEKKLEPILTEELPKDEPPIEVLPDVNEEAKKEAKDDEIYVKELKAIGTTKKAPKQPKGQNDIKNLIAQQVEAQSAKITDEIKAYARRILDLGGGGGSVAQQFANGGTMKGDLNVTGQFLSGGINLTSIFSTTSGGGSGGTTDRLISGPESLILNSDGTVSLPNNTLKSPNDIELILESENTSLSAFTQIALTPHGFFAYDSNGNTITFDSINDNVTIKTLNNYTWVFDDQGNLTGPSNQLGVIGSINVTGHYLSGGIDLATLITNESVGNVAVNNLVISNSGNWNNSYTTVSANSASWTGGNAAYTNLVSNSAAYLSAVDLSFLSVSGNWNSTYNTVSSLSSNWSTAYTTVQQASGNWGADYTAYTNLTANSGNWQSTYTTVNTNSANWNSAYNNAIYTINGTTNQITVTPAGNNTGNNSATISLPSNVNITTLNILSTLNVAGSAYFYNTKTLEVSSNIIYFGEGNTGNALDLGLVAHFTDGGNNRYQHTGIARKAGQSSPGVWTLFSGLTTEPGSYNSGINWSDPYLTVDTLSASILGNLSGNYVTVGTGNSNQWNSAYSSTTALNTNFSKLSSQSYNLTQYYDINTVRGSNNITNTQGVITNNAILAGVNNCICSSENAWGSTFRNTVILNGQNNCALVTGNSSPTTSSNNLLFGSSNTICTNSGYGSSSNNAVGGQGNLTCSGGYYSSVGNTFNFGSSNIIATPFDGTTSGINNSNIFGCCNKIIGTNNGSANNSNILGGCNTICGNSNSANYSSILGGCKNVINNLSNTFILGSNITAPSANYTYVNNISSQGIVAALGGNSNNWNSAYASTTALNTNFSKLSSQAFTLTQYSCGGLYGYNVIPICGGNSACGDYSSILGGYANNIKGASSQSSILNGSGNVICSQDETGTYGQNSIISSVILGGASNNITSNSGYCVTTTNSFIGGQSNTISTDSGNYSTISNSLIIGNTNTICNNNSNGLADSIIVFGQRNCIYGTTCGSTIAGGCCNTITAGCHSLIGSGNKNIINGNYSAILGGVCNTNNQNCSFIIGQGIVAPLDNYTFVNNLSSQGIVAAANLTINKAPQTFVNPVTASGTFLVVNINGTNQAIQLWNYSS
jgi:hypothetical protein